MRDRLSSDLPVDGILHVACGTGTWRAKPGILKAIFDAHGPMPAEAEANTTRFALEAIFVYQIALLHRCVFLRVA